jgi:hypothetical protein
MHTFLGTYCDLLTRSCARRAARRNARPDSGVRQFGSELLWIATRRPSRTCGSTKPVVTGLDAVSLSLGVAGDFGCKLRSRNLVLVLEQPFHALCYYKRKCIHTSLDPPSSAAQALEACYSVRCLPLYPGGEIPRDIAGIILAPLSRG